MQTCDAENRYTFLRLRKNDRRIIQTGGETMAHWGMEDVQACFGDTADLNTRQITVGGQRLGLLFLDG